MSFLQQNRGASEEAFFFCKSFWTIPIMNKSTTAMNTKYNCSKL